MHGEYAQQGQNITKEYYYHQTFVMPCDTNDWEHGLQQLHHNNPLAHSSHQIQNLLTKHNIPLVLPASYSSGMAWDLWLFLNLKMRLIRIEEDMWNTTVQLYSTAKETLLTCLKTMAGPLKKRVCCPKEIFLTCLQQWQDNWEKSVLSEREFPDMSPTMVGQLGEECVVPKRLS